MNDMNKLDELRPIANEMLGGLHADEAMRYRVIRAAKEGAAPRRNTMKRAVPAVCMAALALVCVGAAGLRLNPKEQEAPVMLTAARSMDAPAVVEISTIAAGTDLSAMEVEEMAALGGKARVGAQAARVCRRGWRNPNDCGRRMYLSPAQNAEGHWGFNDQRQGEQRGAV